jgi:putative NIF3 family GTP cyclohydrolase 1 type 2
MTFHTRLDAVEGGVNDTLASCLGLSEVETVEYNGENMIRVGNLENEMNPEDFASLVKERLGAPAITLSLGGKNVKRIALLGGSGGGDIGACRVCNADTYVTGEMRYHELLSSGDRGVNLIEAGHFYTEYPVCEILKKFIGEIDSNLYTEVYFSDRVRVI